MPGLFIYSADHERYEPDGISSLENNNEPLNYYRPDTWFFCNEERVNRGCYGQVSVRGYALK